MTFHDLRRNYTFGSLTRESLPEDPFDFFKIWWDELHGAELPEWYETNVMTLSTVGIDGRVSSRIVLLKALDHGFCFFTNYESIKGVQLEQNNYASLNFFWPCYERQVRVEGRVSKTEPGTSDAYFSSRPRSSQLGALASPQSRLISDEHDLQNKVESLEKEYSDRDIPRPTYWGGYRLIPTMIEFWQGRPSRLHDRFRFCRETVDKPWIVSRLAP